MKLKILVLDDEKIYRDEIEEFFEESDFMILKAGLPSEAFLLLQENEVDILILDIRLPEMNGIEVLQKVKSKYPLIEVIMITGHGDMESVIQAMRLGASDYFTKPFRLVDIQKTIKRTERFISLQNKLKQAETDNSLLIRELREKSGTEIIGNSRPIRKVMEMISKVAKADDTSVLITGESGTGKELVARGIHYLSNRKQRYFYAVNCSAIPESLFESEFFGHQKGAFTGATENKTGWFEIADNSTLFLDEIGDLPLSQQMKFLRVLEEKKIRKVGSHKEIHVNVRILAATNQNLENAVQEGKFREDLYHRLNAFSIEVPPLRKRKIDIPILFDYFLQDISGNMKKKIRSFDEKIIEKLSVYKFPGNIRELRNLIEKAIILCDDHHLKSKHFQFTSKPEEIEIYDLQILEKTTIQKVLRKTKHNKSKAAKILNISRQSLDRRLEKYKI